MRPLCRAFEGFSLFQEDGGSVPTVNLGNNNEPEADDSSTTGNKQRSDIRDRSGDSRPIISFEEEIETLACIWVDIGEDAVTSRNQMGETL